MAETIEKIKDVIQQYEEGTIDETECFHFIAFVVNNKVNELKQEENNANDSYRLPG